jgi:hypothetical protein
LVAFAPMISVAQVNASKRSALQPQTEVVYGWELMTPDEREAFRQSLQRGPTAEARDALRREQRRQMRMRAQTLGRPLGALHRMEINRPVAQQRVRPVRP